MAIEQTTPEGAQEILQNNSDATYVDVRSIPEFTAGHAEGAINIPLLHMNPETGSMEPNPDFAQVASATLKPERTYVVGCKMGGRSQRACELLSMLGYQSLYNIDGGFSGNGQQQGWQELGLPTSTDNSDGVSYESLKAKSST